jgi:hypothetical protein
MNITVQHVRAATARSLTVTTRLSCSQCAFTTFNAAALWLHCLTAHGMTASQVALATFNFRYIDLQAVSEPPVDAEGFGQPPKRHTAHAPRPEPALLAGYSGRWEVLGPGEAGEVASGPEEQDEEEQESIKGEAAGQQFQCEKCSSCFAKKKSLNHHKHRVHGEKQKCEQCCKELASKKHLQAHIKSVHEDPKVKFSCSSCAKTLSSMRNLKNKTRELVLPDLLPLTCNL